MAKAAIEGQGRCALEVPTSLDGQILVWQPFSVREYEFNAEPHEQLPGGERSIIRYDRRPADGDTLLILPHSRLTKRTALGFAPGTSALLDPLEAFLAASPLPDWRARHDAVKAAYPHRS